MESEFIALAVVGKEAEWLKSLLLDIKLWPQPMPAISLYCDSEATMSKEHSKVYNGKSRNISLLTMERIIFQMERILFHLRELTHYGIQLGTQT
jgi:hypothetical protein